MKRTCQTARFINHKYIIPWRALSEIDAGKCENLTYKEVEEKYPNIYEERQSDKLGFKYPGGESYMDVIMRLEPVIIEMERMSSPLLIVSHQAVIRCLLSYFNDTSRRDVPHVLLIYYILYRPMFHCIV